MSHLTIDHVHQCEYHRNGTSGIGFWAVIFDAHYDDRPPSRFIASVFADDVDRRHEGFINPHCAVYDLGLLAETGVTFGLNSWRGDHFFDALCDVIEERNAA
jgi:hypothetical protein